ncbi:hypothetical protein [Planctomonas psychrotolerans]|uniref:hypothetical protein n=1 Tax=Planctomonas psychrotolerans TaxID=2528712 RepID=UPI00123B1D4B|nr:hypothetical protein [Planctomonas psychrotolerans]
MVTPSRKDRLRPLELVGFSFLLALFTGVVVLVSTRDFVLAGIFLGIVFIASLVVLAMLTLTMKPNRSELTDLDEQDRSGH